VQILSPGDRPPDDQFGADQTDRRLVGDSAPSGSRAKEASSERHAARLAFQSTIVLIADSARRKAASTMRAAGRFWVSGLGLRVLERIQPQAADEHEPVILDWPGPAVFRVRETGPLVPRLRFVIPAIAGKMCL
jgi:hypothetical protein